MIVKANMRYHKTALAEIQLCEAIRMFLDRQDYVCAATLAGAAENIYASLLKREQKPTALDRMFEHWSGDANLTPLSREQLAKVLYRAKNQLKHAGDQKYDEIEVGQVDAMIGIVLAIGMHPHFAKQSTPDLDRFRVWYKRNAAALIDQLPRFE